MLYRRLRDAYRRLWVIPKLRRTYGDARTESALSRLRKGLSLVSLKCPIQTYDPAQERSKLGYVISPRYYPAPDCSVHVCALFDINGKVCNFGLSPGSSRCESVERQLWQYSSG